MKFCWDIFKALKLQNYESEKSGELDNVLRFGLSFKIIFMAPRGIVNEISRTYVFFILL